MRCQGIILTPTHELSEQVYAVAIELAKLISNKFSKNLKKIIIINPTFYITITHKMIMPFLNNKVKDIIEINSESKCTEELFYKMFN
jgi:hypothetical protein